MGFMASSPLDPLGMMRNWLGEWEKLVNQHGAEWLQKPEVVQGMQRLSSARLQAQSASDEAMAKWLSAANMPSKADVEALGARLARIEEALARIEAHQRGDVRPARPAPKRTRKPGA